MSEQSNRLLQIINKKNDSWDGITKVRIDVRSRYIDYESWNGDQEYSILPLRSDDVKAIGATSLNNLTSDDSGTRHKPVGIEDKGKKTFKCPTPSTGIF